LFKNINDILENIKDGSLKIAKLSIETGIPASRMYKWKDRGSKITAEDAEKLLDWANKLDNSTVEERRPSYLQIRGNIKNGAKSGIPVFTGNTRAGTIEVYSDDPSENEPVDHLPATMFPGCNHAERVSGDSMHPILINQGYAIGKIIDKKGIIYGEKYIVHTKYGLSMVKYLQEASKKDKVKLVSYNKNIAPQEIPYDDITFCCRIYFIVNPS